MLPRPQADIGQPGVGISSWFPGFPLNRFAGSVPPPPSRLRVNLSPPSSVLWLPPLAPDSFHPLPSALRDLASGSVPFPGFMASELIRFHQ